MKKLIKPTLTILALLIVGSLAYFYSWVTKPPETSYNTSPPVEEIKPPTVDELFKLTNEERKKVGVKPLILDRRLNDSAWQKARDMVLNSYYGHVNPKTKKDGTQYINETGMVCKVGSGGENLAGGALSGSSRDIINSWMNSESHREALLSSNNDYVGFALLDNYAVMHLCDIM